MEGEVDQDLLCITESITLKLLSIYMGSNLYMDSNMYNAAINGDFEFLTQNKDKIGDQKTPTNNTVLHLSSQSGKIEAVEVILSTHSLLLIQVNSEGETALHLAAKEGHSDVIKSLIKCTRKMERELESGVDAVKQILRMINDSGDTALHEAVRYNRLESVTILVEEDSEYSYLGNKVGETPLYVAASRGSFEILGVILKKCESPAYTGPNGRTALHGPVIYDCKDCTGDLLKWKTKLILETNIYGQTPLHYAAHHGLVDRVSQILSADESVAYFTDKDDKNTALHMAASRGHKSVIEKLVSHCPSLWDMVNVNGRNALHIALEHKQVEVIEFILEKCPVISNLITKKDIDGNTPIHLLATADFKVPKLQEHIMADMGAFNNQNLTPLELLAISKKESTTEPTPAASPQPTPAASPQPTSAAPSENADELPANEPRRDFRKTNDTHMVVAALIATVSFTAGFTIPGGFIQSGSANQGMAIFTEQPAFQAFIVADTMAFLLSISAIVVYFIATDYITDDKIANFGTAAMILIMLALLAMMVAFITGTYAVLDHSSALAVAICLLGCCFFPIYFLVVGKGFHDSINDNQ